MELKLNADNGEICKYDFNEKKINPMIRITREGNYGPHVVYLTKHELRLIVDRISIEWEKNKQKKSKFPLSYEEAEIEF